MDYPFSSAASTGRRRRTGGSDPSHPGARATRGSKGQRTTLVASVDEQLLGCTVPRLGRTRGTGGRVPGACTWQASRVLQLALLEDEDEREALEALCFLSASSCQLEDQAIQAQLACKPDSPEQQQQGQNSKGSSFTAEAAAAPMQLSNGWLAAANARHPSPGSDVSSDGCQGALVRPEEQQRLATPLEEIHPGAQPVALEHLPPGGTQQLLLPGSKGSRKQQQLRVGQVPQQQQQEHVAAAPIEPHASLLSGALLAMQQASSAGRQHQHAVHAPAAAVGLHQSLLPSQLASLLQAGNYDAAAAAAGLSSAALLAPLHVQQQAHQQPGLSELLGLLSVGLPHAGVQPPQLPLLPMAAQQPASVAQRMPVAGKRPPVKGCYWHVYIANMIAAGRRQQEAKEQRQEPPQQVEHIALTRAAEQEQPALTVQRKSSCPRPMHAGGGDSPCKRQKRQQSPVMLQQPQQQLEQAVLPQLQLPPAGPLPIWLTAAGVLPPTLALAAAAAAAPAAGQAGMLPQLLQPPALSGPLAAATSSLGLLGPLGAPPLPLMGMPAAAALGGAAVGSAPELLLQLLTQQQQQRSMDAAAVRPASGMADAFPLHGMGPGLLQGGAFPAGALLQALTAPGIGLVAQQ